MGGLDALIYGYVFSKCAALGATFGCGATEGFIMYVGAIVIVVSKAFESKKGGQKK